MLRYAKFILMFVTYFGYRIMGFLARTLLENGFPMPYLMTLLL